MALQMPHMLKVTEEELRRTGRVAPELIPKKRPKKKKHCKRILEEEATTLINEVKRTWGA